MNTKQEFLKAQDNSPKKSSSMKSERAMRNFYTNINRDNAEKDKNLSKMVENLTDVIQNLNSNVKILSEKIDKKKNLKK